MVRGDSTTVAVIKATRESILVAMITDSHTGTGTSMRLGAVAVQDAARYLNIPKRVILIQVLAD